MNTNGSSPVGTNDASDTAAAESITNTLPELSVADSGHLVPPVQFQSAASQQYSLRPGQKEVWKPKSYGTTDYESGLGIQLEAGAVGAVKKDVASANEKQNAALSKLSTGNLLENFTVDNSTYSQAQIRATFYPKFENEKSDQEIRLRMIEMVSKGLCTVEITNKTKVTASYHLCTMQVSLKHSGSLFMYAGHNGGAYAKNSYGNIYTAVGVFVLGRIFKEAWGLEAHRKQAEFNEFLEVSPLFKL
ncbi:hypothetical protein V2J09_016632 [Rumex salicifolius]